MGTIRRLLTMARVIIRVITMVPRASGFLATGKADGLLLGGKGFGSRVTGGIADRRRGLKFILQSPSFSDVIPFTLNPALALYGA